MAITKEYPQVPEFPLPDGITSSFDYLRILTMQGIERRYPGNKEAKKRAEDEAG